MSSGRPASSVCCRAVPLIARGAWLAALIGLPPVLELPGALSCEGLALSFSGLRALAALGLLAGIAFAGRISARPRRALCAVGMVSTAAYCALTVAALLKYLAFGASEAIVLGWSAICLVLFGSFACGTVWQRDLGKAETGTASFSRGLAARFLAFALLALGILGILVGNEPNWTFARLSYSAASGFDASSCWHVLAYSVAGFAGPGPHLLRSGVLDPGPIDAACCLAWCAAGMLAAWLDKRGKSASCLAGMAFGVIAARCLAELAPALFAGRSAVGFAALACGAALIAVSPVREAADHAARPRPAAVEAGPSDDAFDLTPLSPREREAVLGRLAKKSSAEVACQMGISPSTVRNLQSRAAKKLGVGSLDELSPFQQVAVEPKVSRHSPMAALLPYLIVFGSVLPVGAPLAGGWIRGCSCGPDTARLWPGARRRLLGAHKEDGCSAGASLRCGRPPGRLLRRRGCRPCARNPFCICRASGRPCRAGFGCGFRSRGLGLHIRAARCRMHFCCLSACAARWRAWSCALQLQFRNTHPICRKKEGRVLVGYAGRVLWPGFCRGRALVLVFGMYGRAFGADGVDGGRCRRGFSCEPGNGFRRRCGDRLGGSALLSLYCSARHLSAARAINRLRRPGERPLPSARPQRDMHFRCDSSYWGNERPRDMRGPSYCSRHPKQRQARGVPSL